MAIYYSTRQDSGKARSFASYEYSPSSAAVLEVTYETYTLSGYILTTQAVPLEGVAVSAGVDIEGDVTDASGYYELKVPLGWSGTVTISKIDWNITPPSQSYSNVITDQTNQDYTGFQPVISGFIKEGAMGVVGVSVSADNGGGSDTTDAIGYYEIIVPYDWTGDVSVSKAGWGFTEWSHSYTNVTSDLVDQGFAAFQPVLWGHVTDSNGIGVSDVTISSDNDGGLDITDANGYYEITVPYGWTGKVSVTKAAWSFNPFNRQYDSIIINQINQDYTILQEYGGGGGTASDTYQIASKQDLLKLTANVNDYNDHFILTADINLAGEVFSAAVIAADTGNNHTDDIFEGTAFMGSFDGNDHVISNLTIDSGSYVGLFGNINSPQAVVKDLTLVSPSIRGYHRTGSLVGCLENGLVSNCHVIYGYIEGGDCVGGLIGYSDESLQGLTADAQVVGKNYVGGLLGYTQGKIIEDCNTSGIVTGLGRHGGLVGVIRMGGVHPGEIINCISTSDVNCVEIPNHSGGFSGGLVGMAFGDISGSKATGNINCVGGCTLGGLAGMSLTGNISNSTATGSVFGGVKSGGLVGVTGYDSQITLCHAEGDLAHFTTSALACIGGLVGENKGTISDCFSSG